MLVWYNVLKSNPLLSPSLLFHSHLSVSPPRRRWQPVASWGKLVRPQPSLVEILNLWLATSVSLRCNGFDKPSTEQKQPTILSVIDCGLVGFFSIMESASRVFVHASVSPLARLCPSVSLLSPTLSSLLLLRGIQIKVPQSSVGVKPSRVVGLKWVTTKPDHKYLTPTGLLGFCCFEVSLSVCGCIGGLSCHIFFFFFRWGALEAFSLSSSYLRQRLAKQRVQWQVEQIPKSRSSHFCLFKRVTPYLHRKRCMCVQVWMQQTVSVWHCGFSPIDWHLIWPVKSFYARHVACNSQWVSDFRQETHSLFHPPSLSWATNIPASRWLTHQVANEVPNL